MSLPARFLTKSRFKLALECPTKLFYSGHPKDYYDRNRDNDFLQALADGGYQIGELAKFKFHPDPIGAGITVESLDHAESLRDTNDRLAAPGRVVIAEAALCYENYFVRVDILIRDEASKTIDLIEVKSKSVKPEERFLRFKGKGGNYIPQWLPYLYDVAFQSAVASHVFPGYTVRPKLLLIDSEAVCDVDTLHQKFKIVQKTSDNGRQRIDIQTPFGLVASDLGDLSVLIEVDVADVVADLQTSPIRNSPQTPADKGATLEDFMAWAADLYKNDERYFGGVSKTCKTCQFRAGPEDTELSGVNECWKMAMEQGIIQGSKDPMDRSTPLSIDIWGGGGGSTSKADEVIEHKRAFLADVQEDDIKPTNPNAYVGMSPLERRMAQVEAFRGGTPLLLNESKLADMDAWQWPLHMIDFETSAPAIPFFKGMQPYQTLAFQFSHHIMDKDAEGYLTIRHANQWISTQAETYPSIEFVRALRKALKPNGRLEGTIFRYHNHENTVLRKLRFEIADKRDEIPDANELTNFINEITRPSGVEKKDKTVAAGYKSMVDLHALVKEGYYSAKAGGSISLKHILPAILHDAKATAAIYTKPGIYGAGLMIDSLNFKEPQGHVWLRPDMGNDPYKTLPKVFGGKNDALDTMLARLAGDDDLEGENEGGAINQGGLAMTAYNYTQFADLSQADRQEIEDALYRYCELDTLAMVILVQGLMELRGKPLNLRGN